jgi:hypothetical protein
VGQREIDDEHPERHEREDRGELHPFGDRADDQRRGDRREGDRDEREGAGEAEFGAVKPECNPKSSAR